MVNVHRLYTFTKEFQNLTQCNQYQLQFFYTEINDIDHSTGNTHTKTEREEGFRKAGHTDQKHNTDNTGLRTKC